MVKRRFVTAVAVLAMVAGGLSAAGDAGADVIAATDSFPVIPGEYDAAPGADGRTTYVIPGGGSYYVDSMTLTPSFSTVPQPLPAPGTSFVANSFFDVFLELSTDQGSTWQPLSFTSPPSQIKITGAQANGDGSTDYPTEMLQLNLSATTSSGTYMLRESPTKQSLGRHTVTQDASGYRISSFFDVFLELSTDGGASWVPADRSMHVELTPEPATLSLLALGGLGMLIRRKRS